MTVSTNNRLVLALRENPLDDVALEHLSGTNYRAIIKNLKELGPEYEEWVLEVENLMKTTPKFEKVADDTDTSDLVYRGLTKLTSEFLRENFGEPLPNDIDEPDVYDWRYVYRISVNDKLYAIYDKLNEDDTFDPEDDIEWFADGEGSLSLLNSIMT